MENKKDQITGTHLFQVQIERDLFLKFKAICVLNNVSMREKITGMIESSLSE